MNNPTAKRKKFYCAAVYTSDAYALDVTDAIAAAGTEPAWQDAGVFKKQLFAKSVNADGYALWAEYIGTPNTVMPANGDVSALRAAFVDDAEYTLTTVTETQGEDGAAQTNTVTEDLSPWSVRGDLLVRRDGTVLVWMGQPTAEELLAALLGQEGSV